MAQQFPAVRELKSLQLGAANNKQGSIKDKDEGVTKSFERAQKKAGQQRRIEERGLNQDLLALAQADEFDLLRLRAKAERELHHDLDPDIEDFLLRRIKILDLKPETEKASRERDS